jgi:uncharacterized protein
MPEYLAPGVYIEEVEGSQPIEGVSTSTSGMVGVAERGPVNVPMLVTSFADYQRTFGGYLNPDLYPDRWYLPHAVEGFFQNGGKRLFVTRVAADQTPNRATAATLRLFGRDELTAVSDTRLAAVVRPGHSILLVENPGGLAAGEWLRVGDGTTAEYLRLAPSGAVISSLASTSANERIRGVRAPLYADRAAATAVESFKLKDASPAVVTQLTRATTAGATQLPVQSRSGIAADTLLRVGGSGNPEYVVAEDTPAAETAVRLRGPLARAYPANAEVRVVVEDGARVGASMLSQPAAAGDALVALDKASDLGSPFDAVRIGGTAAQRGEYHRLDLVRALRLRTPLSGGHAPMEPVHVVADAAAPNAYSAKLAPPAGGTTVPVGTTDVIVDTAPPAAVTPGSLLKIGAGAQAEYVVLKTASGTTLTLAAPTARPHAKDEPVVLQAQASVASALLQGADAGETLLLTADVANFTTTFAAGAVVEVGDAAAGTAEYAAADPVAPAALVLNVNPGGTPPGRPIVAAHHRGEPAGERTAVLAVTALDPGPWGNELRVIADRDAPLLETTVTASTASGLPVPLGSAVGLEPGTILDIGYQPATATAPEQQGTLAKVESVSGNAVVVAPPLAVTAGMLVRTRAFKLTIEWVKGDQVVAGETFRGLSLDSRHSRYAVRILGDAAGPPRPSDRRPEGESALVRVQDPGAATAQTTIRLGPDVLLEPNPLGQLVAVGRFLTGGSDPVAGIDRSLTYIGQDDVDPLRRTGLYTLKNEPRISIVAVPGRTEQDVQQTLIMHCEEMRYRFAVLDSVPGTGTTGASLGEVQAQRTRYDTKYAAIYYPWLTIADRFPDNPALRLQVAIPPSGHIMGIYAATDVRRGVHKAPANSVIAGILGLQRKLNKSEHDLLNPSPVNVNVLRDFSEEGRGLRVYGARVAGSNTAWKYVNVRRLFNFIEASLDQGLQWVVFEPNDARLWAQVRQTVTNFLTRVWRDGALMGSVPEEGFFVKCDETTMTPDDLDIGKLVVVIGIAPVKPAEFVIIRIGQYPGGSEVQEL